MQVNKSSNEGQVKFNPQYTKNLQNYLPNDSQIRQLVKLHQEKKLDAALQSLLENFISRLPKNLDTLSPQKLKEAVKDISKIIIGNKEDHSKLYSEVMKGLFSEYGLGLYIVEINSSKTNSFLKKDIENLFKQHPSVNDKALPNSILGQIYLREGNYAKGIEHLEKAESLFEKGDKKDTSLTIVLSGLKEAYKDLHSPKKVIEYTEKQIKSEDDFIQDEDCIDLAQAYLKLGQKDKAISTYQKAIAQYSDSDSPYGINAVKHLKEELSKLQ